MKYLYFSAALVALVGCQSNGQSVQEKEIAQAAPSNSATLVEQIKRFPPRYPISQAKAGNQGCATVEYVISPTNEVSDVKVLEASHTDFAQEAQAVVSKWRWEQLPEGAITAPTTIQTRFEFCLAEQKGQCDMEKLVAKIQCSGTEDVVASIGRRVR
ncbi:energy transducer TonB [Pseudoalteromonas sp. GB56]